MERNELAAELQTTRGMLKAERLYSTFLAGVALSGIVMKIMGSDASFSKIFLACVVTATLYVIAKTALFDSTIRRWGSEKKERLLDGFDADKVKAEL